MRLESGRNDFEILKGSLWSKSTADKATVYDIGVTGAGDLGLGVARAGKRSARQAGQSQPGLRAAASAQTAKPSEPAKDFYGIGLTRARSI